MVVELWDQVDRQGDWMARHWEGGDTRQTGQQQTGVWGLGAIGFPSWDLGSRTPATIMSLV